MLADLSQQEAAAELIRRRRARRSLVDFAQAITIPGAPVSEDPDEWLFKPIETSVAPHHRLILEKTQECLETPHGRLMLLLPPGSAKSTYAGVVAPAWALGRWPGFKFIGLSYSDRPAHRLSRRCRAIIQSKEYRSIWEQPTGLTTKAVEEWELTNDSSALWSGILGSVTSARADAALIDDPVAGRAEADSPAIMGTTWDAYNDDVLTRLKPGASVILIQTRWAPDDLAGRILPEDWNGESGRIMCRDGFEWEVLCIPAKATREDDPLGRQVGEYLWPEWFDRQHWANFESKPRTWASLFQQCPRPEEGNQFEESWFKWYDPEDIEGMTFRYYGGSDFAVTQKSASNEPDWSELGVAGLNSDGDLYLMDWWFKQTTADVSVGKEIDMAKRWRTAEWWGEKGVIENAIGPLRRRIQRERAAKGEKGVYYHRDLLSSQGDKVSKVAAFRGWVHAGCVYLPRGVPWAIRLVNLLVAFRGADGDQDDAVDVCGIIGRGLDQMRDPKPPPASDPNTGPAPITLRTMDRDQTRKAEEAKKHYR